MEKKTIFVLERHYHDYEESTVSILGTYTTLPRLLSAHPYLSDLASFTAHSDYIVKEYELDSDIPSRELKPKLIWE